MAQGVLRQAVSQESITGVNTMMSRQTKCHHRCQTIRMQLGGLAEPARMTVRNVQLFFLLHEMGGYFKILLDNFDCHTIDILWAIFILYDKVKDSEMLHVSVCVPYKQHQAIDAQDFIIEEPYPNNLTEDWQKIVSKKKHSKK